MKLKSLFVLAFAATIITAGAQSLKTPAPSPKQTIKQDFALSDISIEYSRPSAKGRVVFGDLVPYDKLWRTGANASAKITFGSAVKVEGKDVAAGTYALYTIPGKTEWTIVLNKNLTLWGIDGYKEEEDVLRFKVKSSAITENVETFTINVANITSNTCTVDLTWEKTKVSFNVLAEIDAEIMKNIEKVMANDARPYFAAARYYYENDKDLNKALEWANKAVEQNPKAYWVALLKARIQLKLKDYKGSMATAELAKNLATEDKNDDYVKMSTEVWEAAKKGK
jgi:acetolactate synthase small subunit